MSERVEPALTPEEWKDVRERGWYSGHSVAGDLLGVPSNALDIAHAGMALANERLPDGDPRKITRADVAALESLAGDLEAECVDCDWHEDAAQLRALAAKLAALLPPEGT